MTEKRGKGKEICEIVIDGEANALGVVDCYTDVGMLRSKET